VWWWRGDQRERERRFLIEFRFGGAGVGSIWGAMSTSFVSWGEGVQPWTEKGGATCKLQSASGCSDPDFLTLEKHAVYFSFEVKCSI